MPAANEGGLSTRKKTKTSTRKPVSTSKTAETFKSAEFIEDSDGPTDDQPAPRKVVTGGTNGKSAARASFIVQSSSKPPSTWEQRSNKRRTLSPLSESADSSSSPRVEEREDGSRGANDSGSVTDSPDESPTLSRPKFAAVGISTAKPIFKPSPIRKQSVTGTSKAKHMPKRDEDSSEEDHTEGNNHDQKDQETESEGESESESETQSEEARDEEDEHSRRKAKTISTNDHIPPYEPPSGFETATIAFAPDSRLDDILSPSNLERVQIWHITAPASIPISSIKELSARSIVDGSTILSYKNAEYGLVPDTADASETSANAQTMLIPSVQRNEYRSTGTKISKTLHLQQLIKLPSHNLPSQTVSNGAIGSVKRYSRPRNEQPKGLKMRYHAFGIPGVSKPDLGPEYSGTGSSAVHPRPQDRPSESLKGTSPSKKRKHSGMHGAVLDAEHSSMKAKKRKDISSISNTNNDSQLEVDAVAAPALEKPSKNHNDVAFRAVPSTPHKNESKEDRAKRKATKHKAKLTQPFRVPRSASPAKILTNGTSKLNGLERDDDRRSPAGDSSNRAKGQIMDRDDSREPDQMVETAYSQKAKHTSPTKLGRAKDASPVLERQETAEERRKRKEEKRKRKEERKMRKEARPP